MSERREPQSGGSKKRRAQRYAPQSSQQPRKRVGFWFRFLTMAAIVLAVFCCITLFFQVKTITATGNHIYTEEQIVDASGISVGDNLLSVKKAQAASLVMTTLPFVESVHIERVLPDTVKITVTESDVTFAIRAQNETYYLMNAQGKVLQEIATSSASDYPNVDGLEIQEPVLGEQIRVTEEQQESCDAALSMMQYLNEYGISGKITKIDVSKPYDLRLYCGTQYEILMGGSDNLDYKTEYLVAALTELGEGNSGVIDLTFEEKKTARFQPY